MLKIKDNVDLKELKKYGFKEGEQNYRFYNPFDIIVCWIYKDCRYINVKGDTSACEKLYDLIQAGLVEKVE